MKAWGRDKSTVLALTLLGCALLCWRAGTIGLRGDEAFTVVFSASPLREILRGLRTTEPHPPLYYVLIHDVLLLLGRSELAVRLPSLLSGVLLIPLTYALGRQWGQRQVGVVAAALVALNPFLIWQGQDARMYPLLAALSLASLCLLGRMVNTPSATPRRRLAAYSALTLAALATHYYALLWVAAQDVALALSLLSRRGRRMRWPGWVAAQGGALLAFAPWLLYAGGLLAGHKKDWIAAVSLRAFLERSLLHLTLGATIERRYAWPWLIAIGALLLLGLAQSWWSSRTRPAQEQAHTLLLTSGLVAPLAATFLISLWRPVFEERYLIFIVPLALLFVARGIVWLGSRWRIAVPLCLAWLALGAGVSLYGYHYLPSFAKSPDWRGAIEHVVAMQEPGDLFLLNYPDPTVEYYNGGRLPYTLLPAGFPVDVADTTKALAQLAAEHPRLWLAPIRAGNWDADGLLERWLGRYADRVEETQWAGLRLQLYDTEARYRQTMTPVGATWESQARLDGYRLSAGGQPLTAGTAVAPGELLRLTLYWEVLAPLRADYTVFTHLLDPQGAMRGQKDAPPFGGSYPTSAWQPGERLVDVYELAIDPAAPTGRYTLEIGLYQWPSNQRLLVHDAQGQPLGDHLLLATVQIGR